MLIIWYSKTFQNIEIKYKIDENKIIKKGKKKPLI